MGQQSQQTRAWHALDVPSLEKSLDARPGGLTEAEAAERLKKFGPNELPHAPRPTWWQIALRQFRSPLIYMRLSPLRSPILLGGALIAFLLHVGMMFTPLGREVLHVEPVSLSTFAGLWALALTVFVAMEIHKWTWAMRDRRMAASSESTG